MTAVTRLACCLLLLFAVVAGRAEAQTVAQLLSDARTQIDDLNSDSAAVLLGRALNDSRTTDAQRLRSFTLLAIAELSRGNRVAARQNLEWTLRLDPAVRVDTLRDLHSDLMLVFGEARTALGIRDAAPAAERLSVTLSAPPDTILPSFGGSLPIIVQPSSRARVALALTPADNYANVVWADTAPPGGPGQRAWSLRTADGALVVPGRYALRATALDSSGAVSETIERILLVTRVPVDTQAHPQPPVIEPETLHLRRASPSVLAWGVAISALVVAAPTVLGNPDISSGSAADGAAYAVAGGVSLASVVGWLGGRRARPLAASIAANRNAQAAYAQAQTTITTANRRARDAADVRIRLEGSP